jgi:hypothetical protein
MVASGTAAAKGNEPVSSRGRIGGPAMSRIRLGGLAMLVVAAVSGCVSLQANGPVTSVTEDGEGSSQVQIWPSPPTANEGTSAIVTGFLAAARSGSANLAIADDYLTAAMQKTWKTEQNTVIVLADDSEGIPQPPGDAVVSGEGADEAPNNPFGGAGAQTSASSADTGLIQNVQGTLLGTVDASGVYASASGNETFTFGLTPTKNSYRISSLPPDFGVLMARSDFESSYVRHDVYYENAQQGGKLIPVQVYLPDVDTDQQLANAMSQLVVQGVPAELGSAMQDAVPGARFTSMQFGGDGDATVTVDSRGYCAKNAAANACVYLGQQLAETLSSLSTKVTAVTVVDKANGETYQPVGDDPSLFEYGEGGGPRANQPFYDVSTDGAVQMVNPYAATVAPLNFGTVKTKFKAVAVGPPGSARTKSMALVSQDGTKVYLARDENGIYDLTQVYPSTASTTTSVGGTAKAGANSGTGAGVGQMSWDAYGNLWFTVTQGANTGVYRYGEGDLSQVVLDGPGSQIAQLTQIAAAPDGSRVAVSYKDAGGNGWIEVAAAVQSADGSWSLQLGAPEVVAADWGQITDFDWYNEDSLAVLGIQPDTQSPGLYQIYADGSSVYDSLTAQPVEAGPPADADHIAWNAGGTPIASAVSGGKDTLYQLFVEGQDAQAIKGVFGTSPSY